MFPSKLYEFFKAIPDNNDDNDVSICYEQSTLYFSVL